LNLYSARIKALDFLESLPDIKEINLGYNNITYKFRNKKYFGKGEDKGLMMMTELGGFNYLGMLDMDFSHLKHLKNLEYLNLCDNELNDLSFLRFVNKELLELDLSNNQIEGIYPTVINDNKPTILDLGISFNFTNLKKLNLAKNKLQSLRCVSKLEKLEYLDVSDNSITDNCVEYDVKTDNYHLTKLTKLKEVNFKNNSIRDINFINAYDSLQILNFSNNIIEDISHLEKFTNLAKLELNNNKILDIMPLSNLKELKHLDLRYNNIKNIRALSNLKKLQSLFLSGNPIDNFEALAGMPNLIEKDF